MTEYDRRRRLIVDGLNKLGLTTFEPRGAFYAFPNIAASGMDDESFCRETAAKKSMWPSCRATAFGPAARVLCAAATPPPMRRSKKPCGAWKSS